MRALLGHPGHHRERRLRPCEGLHLRLLVDAEHDGGFGWVQVEADDVVNLLHEQRIVGELEPVAQVRLEPERLPDPPDRRARQARAVGHLRTRPMRRILRRGLQRRDYHVLDLLDGHRRRPARPRIIGQPVQACLKEPRPPLADRVRRTPHPLCDGLVVQAFPARQHDPTPQCQRLRRLPPPRPPGKLFPLLIGELKQCLRASRAWHTPFYNLTNELLTQDTSGLTQLCRRDGRRRTRPGARGRPRPAGYPPYNGR